MNSTWLRFALQLPALAALAWCCVGDARAQSTDFLAPNWGSNFISCSGSKDPISLRAASPEGGIIANGIITCKDDGDALVYAVDYMNFALSPSTQWKSAHLEWLGSAAQRQGTNGRNDWYYDEVRPINVQIGGPGKRVSISNISFRVPKTVLAQARGFGFYVVGGGIFWPITLVSRDYPPSSANVTAAPVKPLAVPSVDPTPDSTPGDRTEPDKDPKDAMPPVERADWGSGFPTCAGARRPMPLKAASLDNANILANGIVTCTDDGNAFVYTVDYMNFSLSPSSKWTIAHLEWFGCGAQRQGANGRNDWIFDEAKPIKVEIKPGVQRVAITDVTCRVSKSVLARARGFGFYVVGGGIMWSILLL